MIEFRINLIRDQVPGADQRRIRYMAMILYLAVAGLALILAVSMASSRLVQAAGLRAQSQHLEEVFSRSHDGQGGLAATANRLQERLTSQVAALQAADRLLASEARPARLIRALQFALPEGVALRSFSLAREDQSVVIELRALGENVSQGAQADVLARMQKDPVLMAGLKDLTFISSQIENNAGRIDQIWHFTGQLAGGGG